MTEMHDLTNIGVSITGLRANSLSNFYLHLILNKIHADCKDLGHNSTLGITASYLCIAFLFFFNYSFNFMHGI